MVIIMTPTADDIQLTAVQDKLVSLGFRVHRSRGVRLTILGAIGDKTGVDQRALEALPGVQSVVEISEPYKLASRTFCPEDTVVNVKRARIGQGVTLMAGPCSVEDEDQIMRLAEVAAENGATVLRGGAFKPRTSPYSFQGLGEAGLELLRRAADRFGLAVVTEALEPDHVPLVAAYADMVQIGARNMQNYALLRKAGRSETPVLLKRGLSATLKEWLMAAEYVLSEGNSQVVLCERGVRSFVDHCRFMLDFAAIPALRQMTHLPLIVDPSHAAGRRELVIPLALGALAVGCDGLIVEVHHDPKSAQSDGPQALLPEDLARLARLIDTSCAVPSKVR